MLELNSTILLGGLWLDKVGQVRVRYPQSFDQATLTQARSQRKEIAGYISAEIERGRAGLREVASHADNLAHLLDRLDPEGDHREMLTRDWPRLTNTAAESEVL
jgi:hypothetical protein